MRRPLNMNVGSGFVGKVGVAKLRPNCEVRVHPFDTTADHQGWRLIRPARWSMRNWMTGTVWQYWAIMPGDDRG